MQELIYEIAAGELHCTEHAGELTVVSYSGLSGEVDIPGELAGKKVTCIARKAFLSRKNIRSVILPETVSEIGDWAFAYCDGLESVVLPAETVSFGKSVFLDCRSLKRLAVRGKDAGAAALLAAAVTVAEAPYLLDVREVGTPAWLAKWDARMLTVLHSPDTEGYSRQVLCGEEDYGSTDLEAYTSGRRRVKVRLALLRLLYDTGLQREPREELERYLSAHAKGCAHEETWQVVLEEHGDERVYYDLLVRLGCVTEDNLAGMLEDLGEGHPEMKAYLLQYQAEEMPPGDFWETLEL